MVFKAVNEARRKVGTIGAAGVGSRPFGTSELEIPVQGGTVPQEKGRLVWVVS
jgi:hypothetical protein